MVTVETSWRIVQGLLLCISDPTGCYCITRLTAPNEYRTRMDISNDWVSLYLSLRFSTVFLLTNS